MISLVGWLIDQLVPIPLYVFPPLVSVKLLMFIVCDKMYWHLMTCLCELGFLVKLKNKNKTTSSLLFCLCRYSLYFRYGGEMERNKFRPMWNSDNSIHNLVSHWTASICSVALTALILKSRSSEDNLACNELEAFLWNIEDTNSTDLPNKRKK